MLVFKWPSRYDRLLIFISYFHNFSQRTILNRLLSGKYFIHIFDSVHKTRVLTRNQRVNFFLFRQI